MRVVVIPDASARVACSRWAASHGDTWRGLRVHQKGDSLSDFHALSFALSQPVIQPVMTSKKAMDAAMDEHPLQREMPLLQRLDGPAIVPAEYLRHVRTYREVCRLCRQLSARRSMPLRQLAEEARLTYQHVTDYFNPDDAPTRRDLPAEHVAKVEEVFRNTAISQWLAARSMLTVLEQMQATARAA